MTKKILITQPDHDLTTKYISSWAEKAIAFAKKKKFKIISLKSKQAVKKKFTFLNNKNKPDLIFFNGHGDYDLVSGQNNEILVQAGENEDSLKGKITYALSCRSAKKLGKSSIKKGAKAYLGYNEDFIFNYNLDQSSRPLKDEIARIFLEPSNLLVNSLIAGDTADQAWKKSQNDFKDKASAIIAGQDKTAINSYLPCLVWDMKHQVCLGNKKAVL